MPNYMLFQFVQETNSTDGDYEAERTLQILKRFLGQDKVYDFELLQILPYGWQVGDPIPEPTPDA